MEIFRSIYIKLSVFLLIAVRNEIFLEPIKTEKVEMLIIAFIIKLDLLVDDPLYRIFAVLELGKIESLAAKLSEILLTVCGIKNREYNARFSFGVAKLLLRFTESDLKRVYVRTLAKGIVNVIHPVDSLCGISSIVMYSCAGRALGYTREKEIAIKEKVLYIAIGIVICNVRLKILGCVSAEMRSAVTVVRIGEAKIFIAVHSLFGIGKIRINVERE